MELTKPVVVGAYLRELAGRMGDNAAFSAIDVGCRGSVCPDLTGIGACVDVMGFDADAQATDFPPEASRGWRSLRVRSTPLGRRDEAGVLHVTRAPGCSSLLPADRALADSFSRGHRYETERTVDLVTRALDDVVRDEVVRHPRYMKIDVQGWEQAVFDGASSLLAEELVAVRTEVSFRPIYRGQPLFPDIDESLQSQGMRPVGFPELHAWRRTSERRPDQLAGGERPFSRGELIHGDVLYLIDPDVLPGRAGDVAHMGASAGLIALAYGLVDYAAAVWSIPAVAAGLRERVGIDPEATLSRVSREQAGAFRRRELSAAWRALRLAIRGR